MLKISKFSLFLVLIFIFVSGNIFSQEENKNETINFMSFNIHSSYDSDEYYNSWAKRKNLVIQSIRHINPDIIAFQELSEEQLRYLEDELPDYKAIGNNNGKEKEALYNSIFYKKDMFELLETNTYWLSENPYEAASSSWDSKDINTLTLANFKYGRYQFLIASTQFDKESKKARIESTKLALDIIKNKNIDNVILAGTFNANLKENDLKLFLDKEKSILNNAFGKAKIINGTSSKTTKHDYKGFLCKNSNYIDHIFTSNNFYVSTAEIITYHEKSNYPSNHYPLSIKVSFNRNSGALIYSGISKTKKYDYIKKNDSAYNFKNTSFVDDYKRAIKNERKEAEERARKYKEKKRKERKKLD